LILWQARGSTSWSLVTGLWLASCDEGVRWVGFRICGDRLCLLLYYAKSKISY